MAPANHEDDPRLQGAPEPDSGGTRHFLRRLMATSPNLVYIYDLAEHRNVFANQDLLAFLGYTPEQMLRIGPELLATILHPGDAEAVARHHARFAAAPDDAQFCVEYRARQADGQWRWLRSRDVVYARGADGVPTRILGTAEDVTASKRAAEQLRESAEELEVFFKASRDLLCVSSMDGVFLRLNLEWERVLGYTLAQLEGTRFLELVHPDDVPATLQAMAALSGQQMVMDFTNRYRHRDGSYRWIEWRSVPHGNYIHAAARDITDRRQAEEVLRRSEERYRLLFENMPSGFALHEIIKDAAGQPADYRFLELNPAFERLTGARASDILGRTVLETMPQTERYWIETYGQVAETGAPIAFENWAESLGKHFECFCFSPRKGQFAVIFNDITERKRTEELQGKLAAEIHQAQKLESLGSLAGGIAHDMNNVLAAIQAVTETLQLAPPDAEYLRKGLNTIEMASTRGRDLVKSLTHFARKDLHQPERLDLNGLVRDEMELLRRTTLQKVELLMDLEEPLALVSGERSALGSALMNLCVNALDAMPQGGTLAFRTRNLPDGQVQLEVKDSGAGMPPAVLNRAMEPFYTTKPIGKGTGLGLSSVYATVRAHGGSVAIQSEAGAGTVVLIRLPAITGTGPAAAPAASAAPSSGPMDILLVDDDELIRAALPGLVESYGHRLRAVPGGREALDLLGAGAAVDLVILDLNMPGMNGAETLKQIRRMRPALPVLLATGHLDDATADLLKRSGNTLSITKPFSMAELDQRFAELKRA